MKVWTRRALRVRPVRAHPLRWSLGGSVMSLAGAVAALVWGPSWPLVVVAGGVVVAVSGTAVAVRQVGRRIDAATTGARRTVDRRAVAVHAEASRLVAVPQSAARPRVADAEAAPAELQQRLDEIVGALAPLLPDPQVLSAAVVVPAVDQLVLTRRPLAAWALTVGTGRLPDVDSRVLLGLARQLRQQGYLSAARQALVQLTSRDAEASSSVRRLVAAVDDQIGALAGTALPRLGDQSDGYRPIRGRIAHVVSHVVTERQTGYTLRTHFTVLAQRAVGLDPFVVAPSHGGTETVVEEHEGIPYHQLPGPAETTIWQPEWFDAYVRGLGVFVKTFRPALLHAASDFVNARAALIVGRSLGIPVVYETRGFWEETWLSRAAVDAGWDDPDTVAAQYGWPETYYLRRRAEAQVRSQVDAVVTLSDGMAHHIAAEGTDRALVQVVPNAVDPARFDGLVADPALVAELGFAPGTVVVGYISSLVEYEGIDVLLRGFAAARRHADGLGMVIVGEGTERPGLEQLADELGIAEAVRFTGQVPHAQVHRYYGVIDIIVVPRRSSRVTELVTPLKPYEAMAAGRAIVMSDVAALAGIGAECGAVDLFRADDSDDLARVVASLARDPQRRRQMGRDARAWVLEHRTWQLNATRYLDLYRSLGATDTGALSLFGTDLDSLDLDEVRRGARASERTAFEFFDPAAAQGDATKVMTQGWCFAKHPPILVGLPFDWSAAARDDRSWGFHFHAWEFAWPVLAAWERTGDRACLDWLVDRVLSWPEAYVQGGGRETQVWYDMSLAERAKIFAYVTDAVLREDYPDDTVHELLRVVHRHVTEIYRPEMFSRNNHGVFVALSELAVARRLPWWPQVALLREQGEERLRQVLLTQFAPDGGHLEHSPDYHRMLLAVFESGLETGLITSAELRERLVRARRVLGWFTLPDRRILQLGDSPSTDLSPVLERLGIDPDEQTGLLTLPETGYAVVRAPGRPQDGPVGSYLALAAGFHSRAHKHADDLSVVWYDRGQEILVDAGLWAYSDRLPAGSPLRRLGFFYAAPERQYVESTRAHNTVSMDGADHDRTRPPYGSALTQAQTEHGWYRIAAAVDHGGWTHRRELIFLPSTCLYVIDALTTADGQPHEFRQWFNLPDTLTVQADGSALRVEGLDQVLWLASSPSARLIPPVSGVTEPQYRGWRSRAHRELTPAWSTGFETSAHQTTLVTTLTLGSVEPPEHPFEVGAELEDGTELEVGTENGAGDDAALVEVGGCPSVR